MLSSISILCVLLMAADAPPATATPEAALSEARLLEAALEGLDGLVATFTQTVESPALPSPQVERGTVYLLRPGRMRWEYEEPEGKLAIADGSRTYLYLPEERQAVTSSLDLDRPGGGMSLLLRGRVDLVGEFEIAWGSPAGQGERRPLLLTPRSPEAEYQHLLVETGEDHLIRSIAVVDALGARTTYRFSRLRRVSDLDGSLFRFVVPEGVSVEEIER